MSHLAICISYLVMCIFTHKESNALHPDFGLTTEQLIKKHNYPFEKYVVETDDGYYLELHRIPNTKHKGKIRNDRPILLFSGLFGDSSTWVSMGPRKSLGFVLADQGYDVWMGNNRGSTLCKKHVFLDPVMDKEKFWNFSFQELGYYDIPATIDYVLNKTKKDNLMYIGLSQGTTSYFAMLADKPDYNSKIKLGITLAPVTSLQNNDAMLIKFFKQNRENLKQLFKSRKMYDLFPHTNEVLRLSAEYCSTNCSLQHVCAEVICSVFGASMKQLNQSSMAILLNNSPAGASVKQALHFLQLDTGVFKKYDNGIAGNLKAYGRKTPPAYNLSQVITPTALFYGSDDMLLAEKDVELLVPKLPNVVFKKLIPEFNHIDLVFGIDAPKFVFRDILKLLKRYS